MLACTWSCHLHAVFRVYHGSPPAVPRRHVTLMWRNVIVTLSRHVFLFTSLIQLDSFPSWMVVWCSVSHRSNTNHLSQPLEAQYKRIISKTLFILAEKIQRHWTLSSTRHNNIRKLFAGLQLVQLLSVPSSLNNTAFCKCTDLVFWWFTVESLYCAEHNWRSECTLMWVL